MWGFAETALLPRLRHSLLIEHTVLTFFLFSLG